MLCAVCAVPTRSGAGEVGTNYRGPAVRKWARGLAVLYIFSVFLFSIIICRFANCSFQTKLKFLCSLFHTNTKLVSRFLVGPSLVERPKKFFPRGPNPLSTALCICSFSVMLYWNTWNCICSYLSCWHCRKQRKI